MVVWPVLVIGHAISPLREGPRRWVRVVYVAVAAGLIVYFFAVYLRQPEVCNKPIWAAGDAAHLGNVLCSGGIGAWNACDLLSWPL